MKQKLCQFWKRTNRGLIAAGVLLLILLCCVTVDGILFQQEKKAIEQTVREYVEISPQLAMLSPVMNLQTADSVEQAVEKKMEQNEEILRTYWSFRADDWGYNQGETLLDHVRDVVRYNANSYNAENKGTIESAKGIVQYVHSIVKTGADEAEIHFSYTGSVKYSGDVKWMIFNASPVEDTDDFTLSPYLHIGDVNENKTASESVMPSGEVTAVMVKQDGRWLIDRVTYISVSGG